MSINWAPPDSLTPHKMNQKIDCATKKLMKTFKRTYFSDTPDLSNDVIARFSS